MRGFEQPINIIFILFISLAVAAAVIAFSTNLIQDARDATGRLTPDGEDLDGKVLEISRLTDAAARGLAQSCYETGYRNAYLDDHTCAIVRLDDPQNPSDVFYDTGSHDGREYRIVRDSESCRSFFIEYVPLLEHGGEREPGIRVSC
ncbi:MAG: hypothetical protein ACMXYM_04800 [Candidatus Woesearchaeota archaeon]